MSASTAPTPLTEPHWVRPASALDTPAAVLDAIPDPSESLSAIFWRRANASPEAPAFYDVTLSADGPNAAPVSFARLQRSVEQARAALLAQGVSDGERVILSLDDVDVFMAFMLASMTLGAIAVPLPPLTELKLSRSFNERIRAVCADCQPRALVADHRDRWDALDLASLGATTLLDGPALLNADAPAEPIAAQDWQRPLSQAAYLQYTSGSTGSPKGVIVTHQNLVANLRASTLAGHFSPADRSFSWLPLYHDMGLIGGPLLGLFVGFAPYLMRPSGFVARPDSWLKGITRFRATFIVAPNFAYAVVAQKLPERLLDGVDLSSVRLAFNGAEPIDHRTVDAFLGRFEPYGFKREAFFPVYGLAEATLAVAFPRPSTRVRYDSVDRNQVADQRRASEEDPQASHALTSVSVGFIVPEHTLILRDLQSGQALGERQVGQIHVRGPSVSPGYWGKDVTADPELATGDIGYVADDQLYIIDRLKDLIIIAGQNFAPSDIERHVGRINGLRLGRVVAYTRPNALGTQALQLVAEISPGSWRPFDQVEREVRHTLQHHFGLALADLQLVPPGSIPKTSSGKIKRQHTRRLAESGQLRDARDWPTLVRTRVSHIRKQLLTLSALAVERTRQLLP
ncbi:fatty acyl-AMP ligase [Lujinxingia vulgaris]|uniref:Fatty acyl-AMP ligase n=1 Tax=Lujinxingia vulgaris TaxID=2600176 RepID=A0A5C6X767_9DELT|nr:AMP-binding protein [Lujinxingia vulgaris]TXD37134.1 fatty acyl-AMP ligase [Lujinxingia vulgaris]